MGRLEELIEEKLQDRLQSQSIDPEQTADEALSIIEDIESDLSNVNTDEDIDAQKHRIEMLKGRISLLRSIEWDRKTEF